MSLNLKSSGGGSVTVDVPSTASNYTATLPAGTGNVVVNGINGALVSGTSVTASGTSIDFTSIPSWVKRITVSFGNVSTNGSSNILLQLGSGSVTSSGYLGAGSNTAVGAANYTTGFGIYLANAAASVLQGSIAFTLLGSNLWVGNGTFSRSDGAATGTTAGTITLSGTLDRVRITTVNGTDTFDAGSINILYE